MNQPDQSFNINVFDQINSICNDFRRKWKHGDAPKIEDFLSLQDDESARFNLFRNLLHIDIEFRRRAKKQPTSKEYIDRFPEYARLIRQAFLEDTMMSVQSMNSTPGGDFTASFDSLVQQKAEDDLFETPAANRLGDYMLIQELGRGGFGVVFEAQHAQRQNRVALKTLPMGQTQPGHDDAERLHKFRREFRSLADINHPNLVGMQTLEADGGQWFFTMDLIDGEDFISYVRPNEQLDEERLRAILPQLASGIMALHAARIIHRDLKPSNVLVDGEGKVTILDFGLVAELEQQTDQTMSMQSSRFAGTPVYSAPEQMLGKAESVSDWYAMGVMMYEALTGERPFQGTLGEIIKQKIDKSAPLLEGRVDGPAELAKLTDGLLQRDPKNRPNPLDIAKEFTISSESAGTETFDLDFGPTIDQSGPVLIGRDKQLAELNQLNQQLLDERKPLAVFITGKSGEGKSSLAEKFLRPLRLGTDVLVLSGRCYDRESVPFKAIDSFLDSLVAFLRGRSDEEVIDVLPEDIPMLAHLFPVLGRVKAIADLSKQSVSQLDNKQIRFRAFNALGELLANIGTQLPIVMFIDDLQWGDSDSADVLFGKLTSSKPPALLLVGSFRSDEAEESPFLKSWESSCSNAEIDFLQPNVAVGPLNQQQCVALMTHRFGESGMVRKRATELFTSTAGNPYFLDQLIESFDPDTGSFTPIPLSEVIANRLSKLSADAGPLLEIIAVSGSAMSPTDACQAAGQSESAYATVTHMRTERLVRLIGAEDNQIIDTYHDKIRETVLDGLDEGHLQRLHLAIGQMIERTEDIDGQELLHSMERGQRDIKPPPRVFDLAFHFSSAGDPKALVYSILAAEQAVSQYALPMAIDHYQAAERLMDAASDLLNYRVWYGMGTALQLSGQYELANQKLDQAVEVASDTLAEIRAKLQHADIIYKTGSLRDSIAACAKLLEQLGCPVPKTRLGKHVSASKHRIRRRLLSKRKRGLLDNDERREKSSLLIEVLRQITFSCCFRDRDTAMWASFIADDLAMVMHDRRARIVTAAMRVLVEGFFTHNLDRIEYEASISSSYADRLNDSYGQAISSMMHAASNLFNGQFQSTISEVKKAIERFDQLGDVWRRMMAEVGLAIAFSRGGEFASAQRIACIEFPTSVKFGQSRLAMGFLGAWLESTDRLFPLHEMMATFEPVSDDLFYGAYLKSQIAGWYLKNGNIERAIEEARTGIEFAVQIDPCTGAPSAVFPLYAQSLREYAEAINSSNKQEWRSRREAFDAAKQAVRYTRKSTMFLPYALRELALNYMGEANIARHTGISRKVAM